MSDDVERARAELLSAAAALGDLLQRHGEQHWADWVLEDRQRIEAGEETAIDHLLSAYGGMGSLNDVVIYRTTGALPRSAEYVPEANERLYQLRERTYDAAQRLKARLANPS
jgi:hypothetical protein